LEVRTIAHAQETSFPVAATTPRIQEHIMSEDSNAEDKTPGIF
jgi:hypothetical protein